MKIPADIGHVLFEAIEQAKDTFFVTSADGVIVYVNPAFEALTGYSRREVVGKRPSILKSGNHSPEFYREMWATIRSGRRWSGRLTNRRKDGSLYTEEVRIFPVTGDKGEHKYYLALRHDIAREAQLEEQLNQAQKMESLGLLAGQMSHDFNNLLTVIIGSMELIMEELKPDSVGQKLSVEILRSSKEAAALIKQLMTFARRHESRAVETSLNAPIGEMKMLLESLLGKNVSAEYSLSDGLAKVKLEPEHLKQAVMNLAANARDAMNGSGKVHIRTYNADAAQLPASLPPGRYAVLEFSDTGPGIPKEVLPRMFEPFFTTKPKGKGTGLGLSTVYGVVHQNGGSIFADNLPDGGAVFRIYFPAVD